MAKKPDVSFNFGAFAPKKAKGGKKSGGKNKKGGRGNAWAAYVGGGK
jgi:hypothetical protein